ncbi:MAG: single-stranded DNA-binding protein [Saprospiraceae bacterium]|nr:single-stranded DNA-binding protein [Saprospiraceae bacterium]
MVNRVMLIGNLGKDPEIRSLENGAMVAKFTLATHETYKDKNGEYKKLTEWHDIVMWRELAERAQSMLKKGMQVYIEGKLTHRTWQDQDNNTKKITEVVANTFRILGARKEEQPDTDNAAANQTVDTPVHDTVPENIDDGLPF